MGPLAADLSTYPGVPGLRAHDVMLTFRHLPPTKRQLGRRGARGSSGARGRAGKVGSCE
jgi:hypothetical protein